MTKLNMTVFIRVILFLLFINISSIGITEAQWNMEKCPTKQNLNAISLSNDNSGWIVGDNGIILSRINNIWREYQKITSANLTSVCMISKEKAWAVGTRGTIIQFDGEKWTQVISPTEKKLLSVHFKDSENGIATGEFGTILLYKNGNWVSLKNDFKGNLYTTSYEDDFIWLGGWRESYEVPVMKVKIDDKVNLISQFNHMSSVTGISILNHDNGWAVGCPSFILHFNGDKWERWGVDEQFSSLNSISFLDESKGITVGFKGTILVYSDQNWVKQNLPFETQLNGCAITGTKYYAVGDSGTILSWNYAPEDDLSEKVINPLTIEIYPNPADEILNYILPDESIYKADVINVVNINGQIVLQKKIQDGEAGSISQINTSVLNNGIYFLKANSSEGKTISVKFIIKR